MLLVWVLALGSLGCAATFPGDVEVVSVEKVDSRERPELAGPPREKGGSLVDPYRDFLVELAETKSEGLRPSDVRPFFQRYANDPSMKSRKPSRPLLLVELLSQEDLVSFVSRNSFVFSADAWLCERRWDRVLLAHPSVYYQGLLVSALFEYEMEEDKRGYRYYVFLNVVDPAKVPSSFSSFDLRRSPEAVCLRLRISSIGLVLSSNRVVVPKAVIVEALEGGGPVKVKRKRKNGVRLR